MNQLKEARCFKELGLLHFKLGDRHTAIEMLLETCENNLGVVIELCRIFDVPD